MTWIFKIWVRFLKIHVDFYLDFHNWPIFKRDIQTALTPRLLGQYHTDFTQITRSRVTWIFKIWVRFREKKQLELCGGSPLPKSASVHTRIKLWGPFWNLTKIHMDFQNLTKICEILLSIVTWVKFAPIWPSSHGIRAVWSLAPYENAGVDFF